MIQHILAWKELFNQGYAAVGDMHDRVSQADSKTVLLCGMGGSGMPGRVLEQLLAGESGRVFRSWSAPQLPAWAQEKETFSIFTSYSGNTWETLEAYKAIGALGERSRMAITSGGLLEEYAQADGVGVVRAPHGITPRASLPYLLGAHLGIISNVLDRDVQDISAAFGGAHWEASLPVLKNAASYADLIKFIGDNQVVHVWGVSSDTESAAYRLQTQLNENAKITAVTSLIPELNHNLLVGFDGDGPQAPVILLATDYSDPKIKKSVEALEEVLKKRSIPLYKPTLFGDNWRSQLAYALWWADFASYYLGCAKGCDIEQTLLIDDVKKTFSRKTQEL